MRGRVCILRRRCWRRGLGRKARGKGGISFCLVARFDGNSEVELRRAGLYKYSLRHGMGFGDTSWESKLEHNQLIRLGKNQKYGLHARRGWNRTAYTNLCIEYLGHAETWAFVMLKATNVHSKRMDIRMRSQILLLGVLPHTSALHLDLGTADMREAYRKLGCSQGALVADSEALADSGIINSLSIGGFVSVSDRSMLSSASNLHRE